MVTKVMELNKSATKVKEQVTKVKEHSIEDFYVILFLLFSSVFFLS
jgi:hypothetical protein